MKLRHNSVSSQDAMTLESKSSSLEKYFNFSVHLQSRIKAFGVITFVVVLRVSQQTAVHSDYSAWCAARYFLIPILNRRSFQNNSTNNVVVQPWETLPSPLKLKGQNLIIAVLYRLLQTLKFGGYSYKHLIKFHIYAQKKETRAIAEELIKPFALKIVKDLLSSEKQKKIQKFLHIKLRNAIEN